MELNKYPGKYIVIEGTDGTGKSTQVQTLLGTLAAKGIEAVEIHEPEAKAVEISSHIRKIIKNADLERSPETNLLLFTAARREIWHQLAAPALTAGKYVLSARNYYSTLAYQGYGEGLPLETISQLTERFTDSKYMTPDFACILTMDDESKRLERIHQRGELENPDTFESRGDQFQTKVNYGYLQIAERYNLPIIDASQSIEMVHTQIIRQLGVE